MRHEFKPSAPILQVDRTANPSQAEARGPVPSHVIHMP